MKDCRILNINNRERSSRHQLPAKNSKASIGTANSTNRSGSLEKPVERSSSLSKSANRLEKLVRNNLNQCV